MGKHCLRFDWQPWTGGISLAGTTMVPKTDTLWVKYTPHLTHTHTHMQMARVRSAEEVSGFHIEEINSHVQMQYNTIVGL